MTLLGVTGGAAFVWKLYRDVEDFVGRRELGPLRIYSAPFVLQPGVRLSGSKLFARLRRLGYRQTSARSLDLGSFRVHDDHIEIGLRSFSDPFGARPGVRVRLDVSGGVVSRLRTLRGRGASLDEVWLEPELLGSYAGGVLGERKPVRIHDLPRHVISAVLAAEDERFASHVGVDPVGILRATFANVSRGEVAQGGSTITQQLAKNVFLTPERRWTRKVTEAVLSLFLEARLTKEEILESYLNTVYMGRVGSIGLYGIAPAARAFFGKAPRELTIAEAATLAGLIHAPNADSPLRHPDRALRRRNQVLANMAANDWVTAAELHALRSEPLRPVAPVLHPLEAPFFVDEVLRRLGRLGYSPEYIHGMAVYTTVDLEVQRAAERAAAEGLAKLEKRFRKLRRSGDPLEAAVVVLEPETGHVRALVGGRDFARTQFNRATRSRRQPGSAFKPFVYLAAIDDPANPVTAASRVRDVPLEWRVGNRSWTPTNYDGRFLGEVSVRDALEGSRNVPTVLVAEHVGFHRVAELARRAGLGSVLAVPAMALGAEEVSPLDLTAGYTVFPNLGEVTRPALIRGVVSHDGEVHYQDRLVRRRVATGAAAYVASNLLSGVVNRGTGAAVRRLGLVHPVAGKTGTTNDEKDAWFVGYGPELVAGVWVGFDDGTPVGLSGAVAALPIWVDVMREVLASAVSRPFPVPSGVVIREIDRRTGLLASWACPDSVAEVFVVGTEPRATCDGAELRGPEAPLREPLPGGLAAASPEPEPENPWKAAERWLEGWLGGR